MIGGTHGTCVVYVLCPSELKMVPPILTDPPDTSTGRSLTQPSLLKTRDVDCGIPVLKRNRPRSKREVFYPYSHWVSSVVFITW